MKASLQPFTFLALPVGVVRAAEKYYVLSRNVCRPAGRREHFALHSLIDLSRHRDKKVLPL